MLIIAQHRRRQRRYLRQAVLRTPLHELPPVTGVAVTRLACVAAHACVLDEPPQRLLRASSGAFRNWVHIGTVRIPAHHVTPGQRAISEHWRSLGLKKIGLERQPNAFGNALGNSIVGAIKQSAAEKQTAQIERGIAEQERQNSAALDRVIGQANQAFDDRIATEVGAQVDQDIQVAAIEQGIVSDTEASFIAPQLRAPTIPASVQIAIRDAARLNLAQTGGPNDISGTFVGYANNGTPVYDFPEIVVTGTGAGAPQHSFFPTLDPNWIGDALGDLVEVNAVAAGAGFLAANTLLSGIARLAVTTTTIANGDPWGLVGIGGDSRIISNASNAERELALATNSAKADVLALKNASQSPAGRNVDFLINERAAAAELRSLEGSVEDAHFVSRHGPETTLAQQQLRASTGMTPDLVQGRKIDASRWSSYQDMSEAIQKAQTIYNKTGQTSVTVDLGRTIGDGYLKGGATYSQTTKAVIRFDANGMPYTAYPKLR